jgi:hypothetical protein
MSGLDPVWRALVQGETACPDGPALAKLGRLLREHEPPQPVELCQRVQAAVRAVGEESEQIADFYEDQQAAVAARPDLVRLRRLLQEGAEPPRPVDLAPRVNEQVERQRRRSPRRLDPAMRWRIWLAVAGAHIAALLALFIIIDHWRERAGVGSGLAPAAPRWYQTDLALVAGRQPAHRWEDLGRSRLLAPRADPALAQRLHQQTGVTWVELTEAGCRWLRAQRRGDGRWAGDSDARSVAVDAAVVAALLAAGDTGPAVQQALVVLPTTVVPADQPLTSVARALRALALVDACVLLPEQGFEVAARSAVAALDTSSVPWAVLARRQAAALGWSVTATATDDQERVFLAFTAGEAGWADGLLHCLPTESPALLEPGEALLGGAVLRDVGGLGWLLWRERMQAASERFMQQEDRAWLPGEQVTGAAAGDALLATALVLIDLQLPWRYAPIVPESR